MKRIAFSKRMRLRSGKTVRSIFTGDSSSSDEVNDDSDDSSERTVSWRESSDTVLYFNHSPDRRPTEEIISLAIDHLNEIKAAGIGGEMATPTTSAATLTTSAVKITPERKNNTNGENYCGTYRVTSSFCEIGYGVHRLFKGICRTNRRLAVYLIVILTSLSLLLSRYSKRYLTREQQYKHMLMRERSQKATATGKTSTFSYTIYTINIIAILFFSWKFTYHFDSSPDPRSVGLDNCNEVTFPPASRIHAWHILPPDSANLSISEVLYRGLPVVLHVRNEGTLSEQHRINVLKTLSANNFHVLASVSPLSDLQTIKVWSHLTKVSNNSVYPWFDQGNVDTIKKLASTMCNDGYPPSGIIMETKKMANIRFHSMEIWSSSCKPLKSNKTRKFNFLKCPTSSDSGNLLGMHEEISSCLRAVDATKYVAY